MLQIPRDASVSLRGLARGFPLVAVTGPRQSGKTTLVRATFPGKTYVSLEDPDERALALAEPRAFLGRFARGAILDEVQRAPVLGRGRAGLCWTAARVGVQSECLKL